MAANGELDFVRLICDKLNDLGAQCCVIDYIRKSEDFIFTDYDFDEFNDWVIINNKACSIFSIVESMPYASAEVTADVGRRILNILSTKY